MNTMEEDFKLLSLSVGLLKEIIECLTFLLRVTLSSDNEV